MFQPWWQQESEIPILIDLAPVVGALTGIGYYTYHVSRLILEHYPVRLQFPEPIDPNASARFTECFAARYPAHLFKSGRLQMTPQHGLRSRFRLKPRLFHMTNVGASINWGDTPLIVTAHDIAWLSLPKEIYPEPPHEEIKKLPVYLTQARRIISVSECTKRDLHHILGIPLEKITVIPHGAPQNFFPAPSLFLQLEARRKLSDNKPYFLHVGSLEPRKNLVRLIEAFAEARGKGVKHHLLLVGQKLHDTDRIVEAIAKYKLQSCVSIRGYVSEQDLREYYWGADAFVVPSLYEGFGIPALEAITSGTPVIASKTGALPEVLGKSALYVNPLNSQSIAKALIKFAKRDMDVPLLIRKGLKQSRNFSWQKTAELTWNVYREVLNDKRLH